jgi:DNA-binding HxlR family transcriptional regulator
MNATRRGATDDWCPIRAAQRLLGPKWPPVIVHRLLREGPMGFSELDRAIEGISAKVLSDNLDVMAEAGLVERTVVSEKPFRVEYDLTEFGETLRPVVETIHEWGTTHLSPEDAAEN